MKKLVSILKKTIKNPFLIFYYAIQCFKLGLIHLPYFHFIKNTKGSETSITFSIWFIQKVIGVNREAYWPMHHSSIVSYPNNVYVGIDTCPGYNPGCYVHAVNKIYIGDYTQIAPNVGLMSGNHDLYDYRIQKENSPIIIGKHCWLGMGVVILPGVVLGDFTIVGAGAIVTKSFPEGKCIIVGNPAKKIKDLKHDNCIEFQLKNPYNGYIPSDKFEAYRKNHLNV